MDQTNDHWIPVGPAPEDMSSLNVADVSGGVWAIAFSASFDGRGSAALFIGTAAGGVWRSTDFASVTPTWSPLADHVPSLFPFDVQTLLLAIGAIAVDPNHTHIIYAGTGIHAGTGGVFDSYGRGILKSIDGGGTWKLLTVSDTTPIPGFSRIFVDPTDSSGGTVYAAGGPALRSPLTPPTLTLHGINKTVNGGTTWALAHGRDRAAIPLQ